MHTQPHPRIAPARYPMARKVGPAIPPANHAPCKLRITKRTQNPLVFNIVFVLSSPHRPRYHGGNVPGVYVSYPFCAQKCTYCNFASGVFPRELEAPYLDALAREIRAHQWAWTPDTVYLGGGTPSNLDPDALDALLALIPGRPWAEATLEAAPGNITAEPRPPLGAAGINRVSLGVQSFVEREIRRTGRKHTAEIVAAEIATLRDAGIARHQHRPDRRTRRPDRRLLARIAGLDRAPRPRARLGLHARNR